MEGQEVRYALDDPMALAKFLIHADIRLVRAEYLWSLCEAQQLIPRRQEVEDNCFQGPNGLQSALVGHEEVARWARGETEALLCSVSHCWEAREHADPCGHQLQVIVDCTHWYAEAYDAPVWLFIDYSSLFQYKRFMFEEISFRRAMAHMHLLYCHEYTMTLRVQSCSSDQLWNLRGQAGHMVRIYDEERGTVREVPLNRLTRNPTEYLDRGWCQAELEWSSTRSASTSNQRIDVDMGNESKSSQKLKGKAPMTPDEFRSQMQELKFTHRSDADAVFHLQESVFMEKVTRCNHPTFEYLDSEGVETLCQCLPHYKSMESLKLLSFECNDAAWMTLVEGLKQLLTNNLLQEMELTFAYPKKQQADFILEALAEALQTNSSLARFRLDARKCPSLRGLQPLADALQWNTTLIHVDVMGAEVSAFIQCSMAELIAEGRISGCLREKLIMIPFKPAWVEALDTLVKACARNATAAPASQGRKTEEQTAPRRSIRPPVNFEALERLLQMDSAVTKLEIIRRSLGDEQAKALARAIKVNKTVTRIHLSENQIGAAGAQALAQAIQVNNTLTAINFSENQIGAAGAQALAEAIKVNETVTEIDLCWNQIGDAGAQALAEAIKVNQTVTQINLYSNWIGNAGAQAFAEAIKVNQTVTQVNLWQNQIGAAGAEALAEAIKVNETLTAIYLGDNHIGDAGAQALAEAIKVNQTVTQINLYNNQIGAAGAEALAEAIKVNTTVDMIN